MRKIAKSAVILSLFAIMFSGCGRTAVPDDIQKTTLTVNGSGAVTVFLVGEFDKSYYDLSELTAMVQEEAAEFDGKGTVTVEGVDAAQDGSGRVVVSYRFDGSDSYQEFMGDRLFYGTVSDAVAQGYCKGVTLQSVEDGSRLTEQDFSDGEKRHLIITDASAVVCCPEKVTHISEGALLNRDGSVDTSQAKSPVYILLRK